MRRAILLFCVTALLAQASTKLTVMVVDAKTGHFVTDLKAGDFSVLDDKTPKRVEAAELTSGPIDAMLLLDTSLVGAVVQPVAANLIAQLGGKEQMGVVSFHSSADLIQEFTSSKTLLLRAINQVKYGNVPHLLDALYATIDGGFDNATFRRVVLMVTAGYEGGSQMSEKDVYRLARKNGVSIAPVFVTGYERSMFENLARQTAGVPFNLRELKVSQPGPLIFDTLRQSYTITITGNLQLGDKLKVEVRRQQKLFISVLPQD